MIGLHADMKSHTTHTLATQVSHQLVSHLSRSSHHHIDIFYRLLESMRACTLWWWRDGNRWMPIAATRQSMHFQTDRTKPSNQIRRLHCNKIAETTQTKSVQQRHHIAINFGKIGKHRYGQLRQAACALARLNHYIPTSCSMRSNKCSQSSVCNANPKHNRTTISQKCKRIMGNAVQTLCQCFITTHVSRWSTCRQQNHTGCAHFYERNKFAYCSHHRLKHQSVALGVVSSNVQFGTHGLRLTSTHTYLYTLIDGICSACHNALRMQHSHCVKPLLA